MNRAKPCACTGVRWCAHCRDPRVRERFRMDDPVELPPLLSVRPTPIGLGHGASERIFEFDLERQEAPGCPAFRGLRVLRDFLTETEAQALLAEIEGTPFLPAQSGKSKQHYGPKINFNKQKINLAAFRGLPGYVHRIEARLRGWLRENHVDEAGNADAPADLRAALRSYEVTDAFVLRYEESDASNLDFHRDDLYAYGEVILDLSLESDSVLTFQGRGVGEDAEPDCIRVPLPARSLAILYGAARLDWEHAILAYDVVGRRTSLTLRTLSDGLRDSADGQRILEIVRRSRHASA